ncbi:MAG: glutamine synthetase III [Oscillospiraceae bacterium]|nr:glutamine synthetase III [Oscillospiraceae bacterium]
MSDSVTEIYGELVFNDGVMQKRLPKETYKALQRTIKEGKPLEKSVATIVANTMKDWAIENGATHYTHWFQPMTGVTAEKHDSFITPISNGKVIMEFSGKELVQGEPDASSFPSGGLRATFEARGYTAWDATSYAFIKEGVLCIPTVFYSYGGEALDQKTALLRSMEAISKQAIRVLRLFGNEEVKSCKTTVGAEQEYFLIDRDMFDRRKDLLYTGRTLFGSRPPKGQELDDHYFGAIKPRVRDYMRELNFELWKFGIPAKTEHNEVAPAQHEIAPVYSYSNQAVDQNQLMMELMQKIARKHHMVCLLHEKPFDGVNGSGKHNNWSIGTDTGMNLLDPGDTPSENAQFLLFLCAVIKAVDEYQDLLRISVASPGNDHRLGANEAPPAIISIFVGDELYAILEALEQDKEYGTKEKEVLRVGVHTLPSFRKDDTDRNRTSPFAFTGSKFEFRMPGAAMSIAPFNMVLNTAVAEELRQFADELEGVEDFEQGLHDLIQRVIHEHKRILFNGDGYDESWQVEAEKRGLLNLRTTPDAVAHLLDEKNVKLFETHHVYSPTELNARYEVRMDNYVKVLNIEALSMLDMANKDILPAMSAYSKQLADAVLQKSSVSDDVDCVYEKEMLRKISSMISAMHKASDKLEEDLLNAKSIEDPGEAAFYFKDNILPDMTALRIPADEMETLVSAEAWPYPSYGSMLFSVQ